MIVRHIMEQPLLDESRLLNEFDFFNDYKDTLSFLTTMAERGSADAKTMIERLTRVFPETVSSKSQSKWESLGRETFGSCTSHCADIPMWHFRNTRAIIRRGSSKWLFSRLKRRLETRIQFEPLMYAVGKGLPFHLFVAGEHVSSHASEREAENACPGRRVGDRWGQWGRSEI